MKKYLLFLIIFCSFSMVSAKEETISKTFNSEFINILKVESKYGEIKIENWEKKEIAIDVFIKVESNKERTVEKILSNVGVDFDKKGEELIVKTDFGMFFSFMKLSNSLFRSGEFAINYHIKMPKDIDLDIALQNGDVILFEREAAVKLAHSNGYISSENIKGNATFELRDSHLKISQTDSLFLDAKGSTLGIDKAQSLKGESYNCQFDINNVRVFDMKSVRDKITLKKVKNVFINSSLSDILIEEVETNGMLDASYGDVAIQQIIPEFEELKITSKGANVAISLNSTPVHIAVSHHISTKINIPDNLGLRMKFGESQKDFITTGTVGNPIGTSQILINTKGGELELK